MNPAPFQTMYMSLNGRDRIHDNKNMFGSWKNKRYACDDVTQRNFRKEKKRWDKANKK